MTHCTCYGKYPTYIFVWCYTSLDTYELFVYPIKPPTLVVELAYASQGLSYDLRILCFTLTSHQVFLPTFPYEKHPDNSMFFSLFNLK